MRGSRVKEGGLPHWLYSQASSPTGVKDGRTSVTVGQLDPGAPDVGLAPTGQEMDHEFYYLLPLGSCWLSGSFRTVSKERRAVGPQPQLL